MPQFVEKKEIDKELFKYYYCPGAPNIAIKSPVWLPFCAIVIFLSFCNQYRRLKYVIKQVSV